MLTASTYLFGAQLLCVAWGQFHFSENHFQGKVGIISLASYSELYIHMPRISAIFFNVSGRLMRFLVASNGLI